jgi:AAA+ superfamily predicted ATPase
MNDNWQQANQYYLSTALAKVRKALENHIARLQKKEGEEKISFADNPTYPEKSTIDSPPALQELCSFFCLSDFERDVLLLCAGMELDTGWTNLCAIAQGETKRDYPTFSLAMAALDTPSWNALTPEAPLRKWQLIEVGAGNVFTTAPLRISERILHYLLGVSHLDEQLLPILQPVNNQNPAETILVDSHLKIAEQIAKTWSQSSQHLPIIQLCGSEITSKLAIAHHACKIIGLNLCTLPVHKLPSNINDFYQLLVLSQREAALSKTALLLDCDDINTSDIQQNLLQDFIQQITCPLIISNCDRTSSRQRTVITFDIHKPTKGEQRSIWQQALGEKAAELNGVLDKLVFQFNLSTKEIHAASSKVMGSGEWGMENGESLLWDSCLSQARPKLEDLAQRIIPRASWDDLVLPEAQMQTLKTVAAHLRQRAKVYESWGFADKGERGLGISALFAGVSGTGKTMSAEVLAQELQLDLYRIDLSSVVSKYIGETEKNLRKVFDAAEVGGVILLFDEADALFGKRSEVKDSHDRYANMEVSYLLQRMEAYQGLAILTTNMKDSIDTAFLRRIRFIVKYPFPDVSPREEIWRRIFPKDTPTEKLEYSKLAKLNVAGGNIRNIALNAAFIAADAGEAVSMKHIKEAAQSEYVKLERTLTDTEIRGWV